MSTFLEDRKTCRATTPEKASEMRILVIEDNPDHVELILAELTRNPLWSIETVGTVEAGFEKIKSSSYKVILIDYLLPDGSGLNLIDWVKDDTCVVVMTGHGNERVAIEAVRMGAYDYVVKDGIFFELLPDIIREAIEKHDFDQDLIQRRKILKKDNAELVEENERLRNLNKIESDV
jgi:DNA-binding NtrC family response regulator